MPEITKCLTISTAHISEETEGFLREAVISAQHRIVVYEKDVYGYWIYIGDEEFLATVPEDLMCCIETAIRYDCQWLCLDCDGEILSEIPTYDWQAW